MFFKLVGEIALPILQAHEIQNDGVGVTGEKLRKMSIEGLQGGLSKTKNFDFVRAHLQARLLPKQRHRSAYLDMA